RLYGPCECGVTHGYGTPPPLPPRAERRRQEQEVDQQPLDPEILDAVCRRYLELCPLRLSHLEYERQRGQADLQAALAYGYGSLPLGYAAAQQLVDTLVKEF